MTAKIPKRTLSFFASLFTVGMLLAGCCQRSVLGKADFLTFLAANQITSPAPISVLGQLGALNGIDPNVTGQLENADATATQEALVDLAASKLRLKTLPVTELAAAGLTAGPIAPGFYHLTGSVSIPDNSTIDVSGDGVYVFNIDGNLTLGNGVTIQPSFASTGEGFFAFGAGNVFWNVGGQVNIGAGGDLAGNVLSTGNINVGANTGFVGKLHSLTGSVALQSGDFTDGNGLICPYLSVPQEVTAIAGQPLTLKVSAGVNSLITGNAPLAISAKNLPQGAVHIPNQGGADTLGPNGSDLLTVGLDSTEDIEGDLSSTLHWTPVVPGVYKILYFAQTIAIPPDVVGTSIEPSPLGGAIDLAVVTIRVVEPVSTVGEVSGSGSFGQGVNTGTFSAGVVARKAGANTALGTLTFSSRSLGISGRSETIRALVVSTPAPGQKMATVYGTARVTPYGVVPFAAQLFDGRTAADQIAITLYADVDRNGIPDPISFGGTIPRTAGAIAVQ